MGKFTTHDASDLGKKNLKSAKALIVIREPWLGYLVMGCRFHFTEDIPTAAAAPALGNRIYLNESFFNSMENNAQRAFVILHEILHIFFEHPDRAKKNNYNAQLWNIASDYFINAHLDNLSNDMIQMPEQGLLDKDRFSRNDGSLMSSDEIYHKLLSDNDDSVSQAMQNEMGSSIEEVWTGDGSGNGNNGKAPLDELPQEETPEDIKTENKQSLNSAVTEAKKKDIGKEAGGLVQQLNDLIETKVPWNELLRDFIQSENDRQDFTYSKPNRRSQGRIIFPSTYSEFLKVFIGIDSSGSMLCDDDLKKCISEIQGIMYNFESFFIEFWTCDTEPFRIAYFSSEEGHSPDDLMNVEIKGGGGTEISSLVTAANESDNEHNVAVILSDFMIPEEPYQEEINNSQIPVFSLISPGGVDEKDVNLTGTYISKMD